MGFQGICGRRQKLSPHLRKWCLSQITVSSFPPRNVKWHHLRTLLEPMVLYICGSFQPGYGQAPGEVNRREGVEKTWCLPLIEKWYSKKWPQKKKAQRGWREGGNTEIFLFKKWKLFTSTAKKKSPSKMEKKKPESTPNPPNWAKCWTNKMTDMASKSSWGGGRV